MLHSVDISAWTVELMIGSIQACCCELDFITFKLLKFSVGNDNVPFKKPINILHLESPYLLYRC